MAIDNEVPVPERAGFEQGYQGDPPWNIPRPQQAILGVADQIAASRGLHPAKILDSGCGTGENALYFAARGCDVTGIDFIPSAIDQANAKANKRGFKARFLVKDALTLTDWNERFDNIIDSGVFHVFSDEDMLQYVSGLHHVLKPGGHLFLICFSDAEPGTNGPRRISKQMLIDAFSNGWEIESIEASRYEVLPKFDGTSFSKGGPKAWFAIIRRE